MRILVAILISATAFVVGTNGSPLKHVVGGSTSNIQKYPHQVSLQTRTPLPNGAVAIAHFCGGSIVNARTVVTAHHCVVGKNANDLEIVTGTSEVFGSSCSRYPVERIIYHHTDPNSLDGDVAIIKLKDDIKFTRSCQPVPLVPENKGPRPGDILTVTGWGSTLGGNDASVLQEVQIPAVAWEECGKAYHLTKNMMCAGSTGKSSCQGDSGGPLINGAGQLVGVVSFGNICGKEGFPGVYAAVAEPEIHRFIEKNL